MNNNLGPMTFCIGCSNNLNYLKLSIHSVRTHSYFKDDPIIIFAENCTDGTNGWLEENKDRYQLITITEHNPEEKRFGIGGGMNRTAELVETEYVMFLHADFFCAKNWDLECLKIFEKYPDIPMWVFSQRFQPNLWKENSRPGTLMFDLGEFGYKHDDFNEEYFVKYAEEFSKMNPDIEYEKGEGVSGLIRKRDWDYLGGTDFERFRPSYFEDKDIFFRCQLADFKFVLTSNSVVWHFGSRSATSNFPDDNNLVKADSAKLYEQKTGRAFFEKWGFWPVHNQHQFDVIPPHIDKSKYRHLIRI